MAQIKAPKLERTHEITALEGGPGNTAANKKNIGARYDAQMAAEKELQSIADTVESG